MRAAYSVAQIRAAEAAAMSQLPEGTLMQRAAYALSVRCAQVIRAKRGKVYGSHVAVLCGSGNNGGDALFAVARLAKLGASVTVIQLGSSLHAEGLAAATAAGARVVSPSPETSAHFENADLVLDAIVGIGGSVGLREVAADCARAAQFGAGLVVAVDLPSGIGPDTGAADDTAVLADITVTLGALKTGLLTGPARGLAGVVDVVDIGLEPYLLDDEPAALLCDTNDVLMHFLGPSDDAYKYTGGVVQVIAGSGYFPGAVALATGGARSGPAGLVRVAGPAASAAVAQYADAVAAPGRTNAIVVGPGIGLTDAGRAQLEHALKQDVPVVVDADGLTLLAERPELLAERRSRGLHTVLTPHAGEAVRLGAEPSQLDTDRYSAARALAAKYTAVVVLKGPGTVIATPEGGPAFVDAAGTSALATAGSGDVLAGLIASVLAPLASVALSHRDVAHAAASAVFAHGLAGRLAATDDRPVRATDIVDALPAAIAAIRLG